MMMTSTGGLRGTLASSLFGWWRRGEEQQVPGGAAAGGLGSGGDSSWGGGSWVSGSWGGGGGGGGGDGPRVVAAAEVDDNPLSITTATTSSGAECSVGPYGKGRFYSHTSSRLNPP